MWATDLNIGPSNALASFQLFDFLTAGEFHARQGQYLVHDQEDCDGSTTGMNVEESESGKHWSNAKEQRFFVSCETLQHPGFRALDYGSFFKSCRSAGKVFDMETRTGTTFALLDSPGAGSFGVVSIGATLYDALSDMAHTLEFVHGAAVAAEPSSSSTSAGYVATMSTVKYLAQRLEPMVARCLCE
jgi:hypothetical protein